MKTEKFHNKSQLSLPINEALPGSFNDDSIVRGIVTDAIKKSGKSRDHVADEMSALVGRSISVRTLNAFTANANENHRWPHAWTRAFCHATNDWRLLHAIAERSGFKLISGDEAHLLELGRQYLLRKDAESKVAQLEQLLSGGK